MSRPSLQLYTLACVFAYLAATADAASVNAGMHTLLPNIPGQQVQILATGGEAVSGVDLFVQIGDGGATVGGDDTGPTITNLDLVTGTIFAANNTGIFTDPAPLIWGATTTTTTGSVSANGLLGTLTIDTTGLFAGQYDLILDPPSTGPTAFAGSGVTTTLVNGRLRIGAAPTILGDYNNNGAVDAADYVVWRDTFSQMGPGLAADGNSNDEIDAGDYDVWRAHFGNTEATAGGSAFAVANLSSSASVPEPQSILLLLLAVLTPCAASRHLFRCAGRRSSAKRSPASRNRAGS